MTLGEYLKYIRKSRKIKMVRFAAEFGITTSSVSRFENNKTAPSITTVENWFNALDYVLVPVDKQCIPDN